MAVTSTASPPLPPRSRPIIVKSIAGNGACYPYNVGYNGSVKFTLAQTATFASLWKHWRLNDDDLRALERQAMENPLSGKVMRNTSGVRKMRFAPPSRGSGKSGGFRVCYFYFPDHEIIFFVLLFPKNEQRI